MTERVTQGPGPIAQSSRPSTRWLHGPTTDLLFGCGLLYVFIFIILGGAGPELMQVVPLGTLALIGLFAGAPHYGATLLRVYEHREDRQKYAIFAVGITAFLGGAFAVSLFQYTLGTILVTLYFNWNSWHYAGQNYGLAVMFLRRRNVEVVPLAKRLLYASFVLSSLLAIVAMNGSKGGALYGPDAPVSARAIPKAYHFVSLGMPDQVVAGLLVAGLAAYLGCLGAAIWMLLRKGSLSDLLPALLLVATQSMWFVIPVTVRHWGLLGDFLPFSTSDTQYTFVWIQLGHSLQYLWVTSYFAKKTKSYPGNRTYWLRCLFAGSCLWTLPGLMLVPLALGTAAYTEGLSILIAAVVNLHHFVLDGAIWKLRDDGIGRILLRQPAVSKLDGRAIEADSGRRSWGRPALAILGTCSVAVGLTSLWENEVGFRRANLRGDRARMETAVARLEWIGRPRSAFHARLATLARENGDDESALAELEKSLAIRDHPRPHFERGLIFAARGDWNAAVEAYERAYAIDPHAIKLIHRLANALLASGRSERAVEILEAGLEVHTNHEVLTRQLDTAHRAIAPTAEP